MKLVALVLVVLAAAVFVLHGRDMDAARARLAANARIVKTSCGPIQYAEVGEGAPLLAIHGAGGGFDQGLDLVEPLSRRGFRVIAPSRFGYLGTPRPGDASPQAQARAHACLLDKLGVRTAAVMGVSAGAPSAMQFAILYPDRTTRLVLVVPAAFAPRPGGAPPLETPQHGQLMMDTALRSDFVFWVAIRALPGVMTHSILATPLEVVEQASPQEQARVARTLEHILPVAPRRLGLLNDGQVVPSLTRYELEKIAAPTLVISAKDDLFGTWEPAQYTAANIPGARFVGYDRGGHLLVGHDDENMGQIAAFLR